MAELVRDGALPPSVRTVNLAGEPLPGSLARQIHAAGVGRLLNLYGPSEDTTYSTQATVVPAGSREPAIGRPLPGGRAYVVGPRQQPAPLGVPGELWLGGAGLARGYLGRPELTAERFVPDPWSGVPGARLYRTGDLTRWLPAGELAFLGRLDHQVKVRGFRIELGEVEAALGALPGVREAVVLARDEPAGIASITGIAGIAGIAGKQLVAYVSGEGIDPAVLRAGLSASLPGYMVPTAFVLLPALPLTPNGKADRRALARIAPERGAGAGGESTAPRNATEALLAEIWAEVLGDRIGERVGERVGVEDDFFQLGGHSLLATQVASRVRRALGVEIPVRKLFEARTVAALAREVEALQALSSPLSTTGVPLQPVPRPQRPDGRVEMPPSFAQERLWFLDRLEPGNATYNVPAALWLGGNLVVEALAAALASAVARHEALRTTFGEAGGRPLQVIAPAASVALGRIDLTALPEDGREGAALALAREEAARPFDLARGPLLRAALLRLAGESHLLLLTLHHIVTDGWSMGVLVREVGEVYGALLAGRLPALPAFPAFPALPALPALPLQYADYAVWQRGWLAGEVLAAQLSWWRERLAGMPPLLELATDRPRPPVQGTAGGSVPVALPAPLVESLSELGQRANASLFMVLLAGFQALLARHAGQDRVVVGTPVANRNHRQIEDLIGFFVNTLALPGDLSGDPAFAALLSRARETALGAYAHQELPLEKLVEELSPERSLAHTPLFQALLVLQNTGLALPALPGLTARLAEIPSGTEKFDLTLNLEEKAGGLAGTLSYRLDLFDRPTIERLSGHFANLLAGAVAAPGLRLADLPLLGAAERAQLVSEWSGTALAGERESTLHDPLAAPLARVPERVALVAGGSHLSYGELARRARRIAVGLRGLRGRGAGPEVRIGLCSERTPEMVLGLLGILAAGAAYVPLDPAYPAERLALMLEDSGAALVLAGASAVDRLPAGTRIARLEDLLAPLPALPRLPVLTDAEVPLPSPQPGNLAYLIYTSGSTGRPKAVAIAHASAGALVRWAAAAFAPEELAGVLAATSIAFDLSVFELFVPLSLGGTVILAENALALPALPARGAVTLVNTVPSAMTELVREGGLPASVRTVNLAGEPLPGSLARQVFAAGVGRLLNLYGPSEDTTYSTWATVDPGDPGEPAIGRPLPGGSAYVADASGQLAPLGVPGELWLGGVGLARGYLGRPELTAERFVPDPWSGVPGARLYRTGDLVRWLPAGGLDYLGRLDHQVKIRGFRIELGEIETALAAHPEVAQAAVLARSARPEPQGGRRPVGPVALVAYVAARPGGELTGAELRTFLGARLPEYMLPAIVLLDELPLSPNGKVDRRALSRVAPERAAAGGGSVAPRTATEGALAAIWAEVLGDRVGEQVGVEDDFFQLGGHSLLATQVASRVRRAFGVEIPVRALFEARTVAALAREVEAAQAAQVSPTLALPLQALPRTARPDGRLEMPPSFAQERLWFLDRWEPGKSTYNLPAALRLSGRLVLAALEAALAAVVARHEALRTTFAEAGGRPLQVIAPAASVALPRIDLTSLLETRREGAALALAREEAARPFDLARGPLLRAALLRLAGESHLLLLNLHHIVTDGWSMGILVREVGEVYGALLAGRRPALPALPLQYADYAVWQRGWLAGEVLAAQLSWWRQRLAGMPPLLELPTDRPRPPVQGPAGGSVPVALPARLVESLHQLGQSGNAGLFMVLLAGFQALLARHAGQDRVVVGTPVANRNHRQIEELIGFFVNTLAMPGDLSGDPAFSALLSRARETALGAYAHQELPLEKLVEELSPERSLAHTPLFQALLVLQNTGHALPALPGLAVELVEIPSGTEKFDLTLNLEEEKAGGLAGTLSYRLDLFDRPTIERLSGHFANLLAGAVAAPTLRLADLPLLGAAERAQLVTEWSGTALAGGRESTLHDPLAAPLARVPERVALVAEGSHLSYGELARRARRIAAGLRGLRGRGAGPEVRIGLCSERTPEMVLGLLGILAAGAAYVPLDPAYPAERLALMLEDSGAALVLAGTSAVDRLPAGTRIARLEDLLAPIPGQTDAEVPPPAPQPGNLAYLIYTSGSTGRPKAVAITHASAGALVRWAAAAFAPEELAGVLAATSIAFDLSVFELFVPLSLGGTVILAENALALPALPARGAVTLVNTVPSAMTELVRDGGLPASVRTVNLAGEPLPGSLARQIFAAGVGRLLNLYGPSEDTTYSTWATVVPGDPGEPAIGRPLPGSSAYVVDAGRELAPLGVPGELWLGGVGLARGYLGRPELTAERFVPDAWSGVPGARLYRTGDLVRWSPAGGLGYLGRLDHQVKIRGFRIELGEIETVLAAHPGVAQAAVLARGEGQGGRRLVALVAYVAARPGRELTGAELRTFLGACLPEYMLPAIVLLGELPLSPNGKVDRRALAALPASAARAPEGEAEGARSPVESTIAAVWAELLGAGAAGAAGAVPTFGLGDNFFDLGGHSLLATQVVSRLRETLGVDLPVRVVFEAPTIAALATRIAAAQTLAEASGEAGEPGEPAAIPRRREKGALPLSFAQERLWFIDQLEPGSPVYNLAGALRLAGAFDPRIFAATLAEVVRRHEALRTVFATSPGGTPVQIVQPAGLAIPGLAIPGLAIPAGLAMPAGLPALPLVDLTGITGLDGGDGRRAEANRLMVAEGRRPFDLAAGPLLRLTLLRTAVDEHFALVTLHHIVADGWSLGVLTAELTALYAAFARGEASPLPELPIQYGDFALWQRRQLSGPHLAALLAWWRERLAGAPVVLDLPADRPRPRTQSHRGGHLPLVLPASLGAAVRAAGQRSGTTLFMTLLAAFQALLSRSTGEEDLPVGTPIAGRTQVELERLIGFFVNTLVLRLDSSRPSGRPGRPGFAELLARVREVTLDAYRHQDLPFERLVEELRPERHLHHAPLFQVLFVVQNAPQGSLRLAGVEIEPLAVESGSAKFDLTLAFNEAPDGSLRGSIEYSRDLFDSSTAVRLGVHFQNLLAAAVAAPERPYTELPLLTGPELHQALHEWNDSPAEPAGGRLVPELLAARMARHPDALALALAGERLSYGELAARSGRLAGHLRALGVGPESLVGIAVERSFAMVAALLAIWEAGGAYLPLDPGLPRARQAVILADAGVSVLLTQADLAAALPDFAGRKVLVEELWAADAPPVAGSPPVPLLADHPAYVIYTSGSTGEPKGVVVSHRALGSRLRFAQEKELREGDSFVQKTTISFDASIVEVFGPLLVGGTTVLARPGGERDPGYLISLLSDWEIPQATFTMAMLAALLKEHSLESCRSLRTVLAGGEVMPGDLPALFYSRSGAELYNRYGPTEATISVTSWRCLPGDPGRSQPIGRPIARTRIYLLDDELRPVPLGVAGELCIAGACLARGYLGRPGPTAEKFVPQPFAGGEAGARIYRTGDLARFRADGAIEFVGRIDGQVKIRGFRVELGEIEAALHEHPAVESAAVVDRREAATGSQRLLAYLVLRPGAAAERAAIPEIRELLKQKLPAYMMPAAFTVLPAFPLSPTGKVDKKALPEPAELAEGSAWEAPQGPLEKLLAAIWSGLLGGRQVGREDSFFDLGGHSLLATQVASRVRDALGIELPMRYLFEAPTPKAFAAVIEALRPEGYRPMASPIERVARDRELPLSFAQERLWFLDQLDPGRATYNMPGAVRLLGRLSLPALGAALAAVVERHEALRTTFRAGADHPVQVIGPAAAARLPLSLVDLAGLPAAAREAAALRLGADEAALPFDLATGPLARACLLRLAASGEEHALLLTLHHIVSDGWSLGIFVRELAAFYGAALAGRPAELPPLPVQYADFAVWQRGWLAGAELERQLAWWREHLAGAPAVLDLPADRPRPAVQGYRGGAVPLTLPGGLFESLIALGRGQEPQATLFMTLLAGFSALLGRLAGSTDLVVGSPVANRQRVEIEGLIGFFVNTLALRTDLSGEPGFAALVGRVREVTLSAYTHQDVPFEKLVEELAPQRSLGHSPLFQVVLVLQNAPTAPLALPGLTLEPLPAAPGAAKFDLTLTLTPGTLGNSGAVGTLEYNRDLFDRTSAQRLAGSFRCLLEAATAAPEVALGDLPLLTATEHHQLLREWNSAPGEAGWGETLPRLLAARAAASPGAPAVLGGGELLTYGRLQARAGRLATRLRQLGVRAGSRVGLCLERSPDLVVGLLATLKAGGAYVVLDPAYPAERLSFLLADSAAAVVLTRSDLVARLPAEGPPVLCLDREEELPAAADDDRGLDGELEDLLYVIYTSGSTGVPKGAGVYQRGFVNLLRWYVEEFGISAEDRFLVVTSAGFDLTQKNFFAPLLSGGLLVLADPAPYDPREILATIERHRITRLNCTPSAFYPLLEEGGSNGCRPCGASS